MLKNEKPVILFIHNKYLQKGGEDSVVQNEISILKKNGYFIHYKEFNNQSLQKPGPGIFTLPFSIFFNISAFISIYLLVKKHKIDVVHVHNFFYKASPSVFWAARSAGAKTVLTLHNYRLFCLNGIFFRAGNICFDCHTAKNFKKGIAEKCFKSSRLFSTILALSTILHRKAGTWKNKVNRFVVINPFMPQLLSDIGIPPNKIILQRNVLSDFTNSTLKDYSERKDFYLYVGRLSIEKGVHHLIEAFKSCAKKLLIVGDGDLVDFVKQNVSDNIIYEGAKSKEEVFRLYANCKAIIFPSLWIEGMPMTIIEAQSAGTIPIVAASVNTDLMIQHGQNGFLYEAGNIEDLIRVIDIFEGQSIDELNRLSANARQHFLDTYSETQYLKAVIDIYHF